MSLGGLSAIALAAQAPELVRSLILVDVTPAVDRERAAPIAAFLSGPEVFASFEEMLERTVAFNPQRSESSLRRGVLHNARRREDGSWVWRYQRLALDDDVPLPDFAGLWDDLAALESPLMLVRGSDSPVVTVADVAELERRRPDVRVEVVEGAGHSVQGDRPLELAALISAFGPLS
jgi:pimeloyl-ACP methyl ester carboxylesterase